MCKPKQRQHERSTFAICAAGEIPMHSQFFQIPGTDAEYDLEDPSNISSFCRKPIRDRMCNLSFTIVQNTRRMLLVRRMRVFTHGGDLEARLEVRTTLTPATGTPTLALST